MFLSLSFRRGVIINSFIYFYGSLFLFLAGVERRPAVQSSGPHRRGRGGGGVRRTVPRWSSYETTPCSFYGS